MEEDIGLWVPLELLHAGHAAAHWDMKVSRNTASVSSSTLEGDRHEQTNSRSKSK